MKTNYKFCSICGNKLAKKGQHLACTKCSFVNYRNARPTATAVILCDNKILLAKRNNLPFKGWWDLPGGFLDHNETPEEALRRELKEEMGIKNINLDFFGIYKGTYPSALDPFYVVSVIYLVRLKNAKDITITDKKEIKNLRWFSRKDLPNKIAFDSNQQVLRDFLKIWK